MKTWKRLELDVDFSINTNQETLGPEKMKFKNKKILEDGEGWDQEAGILWKATKGLNSILPFV